MKRIVSFVFLTVLFCPLVLPSPASSETKTLEITSADLAAAGVTEFALSFLIGGAEVTIERSADTETIVRAVVTFDEEDQEPTLTTSLSEDTFIANFRTGNFFDDIWRSPWERQENWPRSLQEWTITIGDYDMSTDVMLTCGGVTAVCDLGGLPLRNCAFELGGVNMAVDFSTPTTRQVETLRLDCGGVRLAMANIGNTDFGTFQMNGGGDMTRLDFGGSYVTDLHDVDIVIAGSGQNIVVPTDAGAEISVVSIAAPVLVQGTGWNINQGLIFSEFITTDYDAQVVKLNMDVVAVGAVLIVDRQ